MIDKNEMPDEIYLLLKAGNEGETVWCEHVPDDEMDTVKYTRADLVPAVSGLVEALKRLDSHYLEDIYIGEESYYSIIQKALKEWEE